MGGAGGAAGVLLGGVLTDLLGWRWILFINIPIGLVAAFLAIEGRLAKAPLMPLRIYSSRTLSAANVVVLLIGGATFGMWFFVSLYLQQVLGYSPIKAGLAFLPMTLLIVIGSTVASRTVIRLGAKPLLVAGMLAQALGLLLFARVSVNGGYLSDVIAPSLLVAVGIGFAFVPATICAVAGVAPAEAGLASGLVNTSRLVGGALGLAVLAALAAAHTNESCIIPPAARRPPALACTRLVAPSTPCMPR